MNVQWCLVTHLSICFLWVFRVPRKKERGYWSPPGPSCSSGLPFYFHLCCSDKIPWQKANWRRKGFVVSWQVQVMVHYSREVTMAVTWEKQSHYIHLQDQRKMNACLFAGCLHSARCFPCLESGVARSGLGFSISIKKIPHRQVPRMTQNRWSVPHWESSSQ